MIFETFGFPYLPTTLPNHPWERVAADLCQLIGSVYLVVVEYYSRFIEVKQIASTTATKVIEALKFIFFSRYGISEVLISDNGPHRFTHITSSPLYPQSNGLAERSVKTVKGLLQDADDSTTCASGYRITLIYTNLIFVNQEKICKIFNPRKNHLYSIFMYIYTT